MKGGSAAVNVKRGMFRLWLLASVLWVALTSLMQGWPPVPLLCALSVLSASACHFPGGLLGELGPTLAIVGPPAVLFAAGYAITWALSGFVPDKSPALPGKQEPRAGGFAARDPAGVRFSSLTSGPDAPSDASTQERSRGAPAC
jgi:hypothetical protein